MLDSIHAAVTGALSGSFDFLAQMDLMDFFSNTSKFLVSTTGKVKGLVLVVATLCGVIVGAMMMFGGGVSQKAKGWLMWIIIEQAIRNFCSSHVQEKQTAPFDIEKKLNEIAKDVRIGNIAALRAFHNLKVDVEDLSFDIDKTQLGFLAQNDFDQALRKKQTLVSERVKKTPTKKANSFFDRG